MEVEQVAQGDEQAVQVVASVLKNPKEQSVQLS